jgi:NDP-sugar pyrophosphorylase family protein
LTDGDIRRGLISGVGLHDSISKIMFKHFLFAEQSELDEKIKSINIQQVKLLPILTTSGKLIKVINLLTYKRPLPIDAFIMAGGKGERLRPLTDKTPKPLLNVGDKPIIEHNIDRLINTGIKNIHISVNYLGNQLKDYFIKDYYKNVNISFVEETKPLGTIGSVTLVEDFEQNTILLMNSDLLTNINLAEMYNEFLKHNTDILIATIPYKVNVPYAVMEIEKEKVDSFKEKPTYTYQCNAGIYLFKRELIKLIPKGEFYNATDLMEKMINLGMNLSYYPILGYWLDIGKHEDYKKANEDIKHLKL